VGVQNKQRRQIGKEMGSGISPGFKTECIHNKGAADRKNHGLVEWPKP